MNKEKKCEHLNLYPDMNLQLKMGNCGHFLIHGYWQCTDCNEWIMLECEDEWEGREGTKTKDGQYQYQVIDGKNKMVKLNEDIPCCDSPSKDKCEQCQEIGIANPLNQR